jgi:hypothetical protein
VDSCPGGHVCGKGVELTSRRGGDRLWVAGVWARVGPAALKERDKHGVPELYASFEALAAKQEG